VCGELETRYNLSALFKNEYGTGTVDIYIRCGK